MAKLAGAANYLVAVPFVLEALGRERFGVWATLCGFASFAAFLDFGVANGAMNIIASARGRGAEIQVQATIRGAYRELSSMFLWLTLGATALWIVVPWPDLLGVPGSLAWEANLSAAFVLLAILISVPLGVATRIQLGLGHGAKPYRWQTAGNILTLVGVAIAAQFSSSLPLLVLAAVGLPLTGLAMSTIQLLHQVRGLTGEVAGRSAMGSEIRRVGGQFFLLQVCAAVAMNVDLPLISSTLGSAAAADFAIVQRPFALISMGLSLIWIPLWPTYRAALASGDIAWALRTFRFSLASSVVLAAVLGMAITISFAKLSLMWIGHPVVASTVLLSGFVFWCAMDAAGGAISSFLNAAGIMRPQIGVAIAFVVLAVPVKMLMIRSFGLDAIVWTSGGLYILLSFVPLWMLRTGIERSLRGQAF